MSAPRAPEGRTLRRVSRQTMVALPTWVRSRLGVRPGSVVYWHGHRTGEVVLARHDKRTRGRAGQRDLEAELRQVIDERDRLRQALGGHDLSERREVYAAGAMQGMRIAGPTALLLETIQRELTTVRELVQRLPGARVRSVRRVSRLRGRRVEGAPGPDEYPSPSAPPSPDSSGGDAASGGETPQAAHV